MHLQGHRRFREGQHRSINGSVLQHNLLMSIKSANMVRYAGMTDNEENMPWHV
jgi:hypothetical protein